jgi:signal transduction histidine kinase
MEPTIPETIDAVTESGFVPRRGPWGLGGTDLALVAVAAPFVAVTALSEARASDISDLTLVLTAAASWLPLFLMARWPLVVLVATVVTQSVHMALVPLLPAEEFNAIPVAVMVAAYSVGARRGWRIAWVAGGLAAVAILAVGQVARPPSQLAANMFAFDLVLAGTGAGVLVHSRRHRLLTLERRALVAEQTREEEARRQVAAERLRMAREVHDVVAHNLTLVNAQSSVAEYLLRSDPEAAARALNDITQHSREALDELRATVGLLRQPDDEPRDGDDALRPVPGLGDLDGLLAVHRASGAAVTLTTEGEAHALPTVSDLAAYRIVQEALTNARKHAPDAPVRVTLRWSGTALELQIDNEGARGARVPGPGTGHGLIGMRERAHATGGTLEAGPRPGGGFTVAATLPLCAAEPEEEQASP